MEGGDPNIINKVFTEILKKYKDVRQVIGKAASVPDGLRHLRNYAKSRKDSVLMNEIATIVFQTSNEKMIDYQISAEQMRNAYA